MASDYTDTLQRLCHHLKQFTGPDVEITPQTDLINQLAIDSVKLLNLIMEVEDEFDISVPLNALADVQTVHELANLIHQIKSAK
ncbi:acyl carrier protein [Nitrosospira sp. Nl5]|uniref:acyl carrier protein n=1 Tax=Nitrosospira sp. Nl5 TaxID=200120 RepID=UPI00088FF0A2|nr:phosphopantetheine-binding protein [Nitrosospira sp. Nl5]SCY76102.1 acyl carrier protein [Nitrosospira sp. Nl5]